MVPVSWWPSGSLRGELQAECAHDLKHSAEPRIAVLRQRLIEPLAGQARVLRKLHHAAGARDVTKRLCQQRRVIRRFLETCLEVGHHIGFGFEVVSSVPAREGFFLTPSCSCHVLDRKSTRLNSSHVSISYAVFCLKKKKQPQKPPASPQFPHTRSQYDTPYQLLPPTCPPAPPTFDIRSPSNPTPALLCMTTALSRA